MSKLIKRTKKTKTEKNGESKLKIGKGRREWREEKSEHLPEVVENLTKRRKNSKIQVTQEIERCSFL